jgi:chromosome segregation ATPase
MENQIFDVLEQKIVQVLGVVSRLKSQNQELARKNQELQSKLEEKERIILTCKEELEQRKKTQNDVDSYKEKQERIRFKIESLVEKLREFEEEP